MILMTVTSIKNMTKTSTDTTFVTDFVKEQFNYEVDKYDDFCNVIARVFFIKRICFSLRNYFYLLLGKITDAEIYSRIQQRNI